MKAFRVRVMLYENAKSTDHSLWFLTIAETISEASNYVEKAVTAADEPESGFSWSAVEAQTLHDSLAFPALKAIPLRMPNDD